MAVEVAISRVAKKYLRHYSESEVQLLDGFPQRRRYALVIPVYDECPDALLSVVSEPVSGDCLQILVLNCHENSSDDKVTATGDVLTAVKQRSQLLWSARHLYLFRLNGSLILIVDRCTGSRRLSSKEAVGKARKIGADIALRLIFDGVIQVPWIFCTDADARLPEDYFARQRLYGNLSSAAVYGFRHVAEGSQMQQTAMRLYDLSLRHYVAGLSYAGSPYAFHTVGSLIAVSADAYAKVRGYPKRAAGEDFYLLNKLAKVGKIEQWNDVIINVRGRLSERVPFGTGPAIAKSMSGGNPEKSQRFYHPQVFSVLKVFLDYFRNKFDLETAQHSWREELEAELKTSIENVTQATQLLSALNIECGIDHCLQHSKSNSGFNTHFDAWFDGFRTLKFIHRLRDNLYPSMTFEEIRRYEPHWTDVFSSHFSTCEPIIEKIKNLPQ